MSPASIDCRRVGVGVEADHHHVGELARGLQGLDGAERHVVVRGEDAP